MAKDDLYLISYKILLIENNVEDAGIITSALEKDAFNVFKTTVGKSIDDVNTFRPDLVIINPDNSLDEEIISLCDTIRLNSPIFEIPIILLSSRIDLEKFAITCDATYVSKPLDVLDFCNTVKDTLSI